MANICILLIACLACSIQGFPEKRTTSYNRFPFHMVTREAWGAREPHSVTKMDSPVEYVVIHHTYIPEVCITARQCKKDMRSMQRTHMDTNEWVDIGYNFAVGGEGTVYEGRSWNTVGAHTVGYNTQSVGIVLIGDFVSKPPVAKQLQTAKDLIAAGVQLGYIKHDYKLIAHRQASATECPGDALFREITTWDHFTLV